MRYAAQEPHGAPIDSDPYFTLLADADGVGFVHCADAVLVIPLTGEGDALLALERSPAMDREIVTAVSGAIDPGETLAEAANRELQEELGWRAGRLDFVGELHPFKYLATRQFVFLARDLAPNKLTGDEAHAITERRIPLRDFERLCEAGELQDALAIAALCLVRDFVAHEH